MSRSVRLVVASVAAVVVTAAVVLVVLQLRSPDDPDRESAPPPSATTPLADYDTTQVAVTRGPFCDAVSPEALAEVLDGEAGEPRAWADGERTRFRGGRRDIAHEFGCEWSADGVTASAWVFAPPVTRQQARALVSDAEQADDCRPLSGSPDFGRPTLARECTAPGPRGGTSVSYRGLFGDAWLTCELRSTGTAATAEVTDVTDRAGRFCVAVARAVDAAPAGS